MGRKLTKAPVYFVIVQARFNPILALESYAPQIQEVLRKQGYPDAQKGVLTTVNMISPATPTEASVPQIPVAQTTRFSFFNMEQTAGFILDQGALSFQTTEYDVFETFSIEFLKGLETVHNAVDKGLAFTDRVGLRYLDAVFPGINERLNEYLHGSVLGLSDKLDRHLIHSFSETFLKVDNVNVLVRAIIQDGQVGFPPDLLPMNLKLGSHFTQLRGRHATLDTDGSTEVRESFNLEHVGKRLDAIHSEIEKVFRLIITEKAIKTWE